MRRLRDRPEPHYRGERCTSRLNSQGCPPRFSRETRYGVRRESATCRTPRSRCCPKAATANAVAPAGPSSPWAAPGQSKSGPNRDPLLTQITSTTRPIPGWILTIHSREFCTLTPPHKLQSPASPGWNWHRG